MIAQRQQKILVVDEANYTRLILEQVLTGSGYRVVVTQDNGEAMQYIASELPDIILLSLRANDAMGVSTLRVLKDYFRLRLDLAQGAEPAIIILSNLKDTRQNREIQSVGVANVLFKPLSMQELLDTIREVMENKKQVIVRERQKIMILDGETRSQQFLESVLAHDTYDIDSSDSEAEFLARIKHRRFDLSVVDLASLEGGVIEALKTIMGIAEEMPIVSIATSADRVSHDDLKEIGVQVHFIKPLNIDVFRTEVDALLRASPEETFGQEDQEDQESPAEAEAEAESNS